MKKENQILLGLGALALLLIATRRTYLGILSSFIPSWEKFSHTPYWDVSRYSWGYGTRAPGATGYISRQDAFNEMVNHFENDKIKLEPLIRRNLRPSQWAALLDFSYQLGPGNADNLVDNINSGNDTALWNQWQQYTLVDGVYSQNSADRRAAEWELWNT